jgi:hypothetical protein
VNRLTNLEPALAHTLRARIALGAKNEGAVVQAARDAFAAVGRKTSHAARRMLAQVLRGASLTTEAMTTLEPLASRSALTPDTRALLEMSFHEQRHDLFLAYAEPLFAADALDQEFLFAFLLVLEDYDGVAALELVRAAIDRTTIPERQALLRVHEALLTDASGRAISIANPDELPSAAAVPLRYVGPVVQVLLRSKHASLAADYAYRCVLRFPDEPSAHAALIRAGLFGPARLDTSGPPPQVSTGTRVEFSEPGDERPRGLVIWEIAIPARSDIVGFDSLRARPFTGKRVGEPVVLAQGAASQRIATITRIEHAWVHQLQQSMREWQERFPELPLLEQCRFESDPVTGQLDLQPMIDMLKRFRERANQVDQVFRSGCVPVGMMAEGLGRSLFETMGHLAADGDLFINCVVGSDEAMRAAKSALDAAKALILDGTALWTVVQLELLDLLPLIPIGVGTVQHSVHELRRVVGCDGSPEPVGQLSLRDDGRLTFLEAGTADEERARASWAALLDFMRDRVRSSKHLASLSQTDRAAVTSYAGEWTAHALAAASADGAVVWSDDRVVEFIGKEYLGTQRVWTQAVLAWLLDRGLITSDRFQDATARLHAMRFAGMLVDEHTVVRGARLASWKLGSPSFQRCLHLIGADSTRSSAALQMALALLRACAREVRLEVSRDAVVAAVVNELLRRDPSGALARTLKRQILLVMRLDPFAAAGVQQAIAVALRTRMR